MNEKLIEKMIIKSFQQYQCSPISKEDQEMLVKHIQTVTHSNIELIYTRKLRILFMIM